MYFVARILFVLHLNKMAFNSQLFVPVCHTECTVTVRKKDYGKYLPTIVGDRLKTKFHLLRFCVIMFGNFRDEKLRYEIMSYNRLYNFVNFVKKTFNFACLDSSSVF